MSRIRLFGKAHCSLCDRAKDALIEADLGFVEVDISSDPALKAEFGMFIPVVEVDGVAVFEAGMNPGDLPELVAQALAGQ